MATAVLLLGLSSTMAAEKRVWVDPPAKPSPSETTKAAEPLPPRPIVTPEPVVARKGPEPRLAEWADTAERFTTDYLGTVSSPGSGMILSAPRFYGERVRFHGRVMSLSALIAEKRRFVRRWPERRYEPRGRMFTKCDTGTASCTVQTVFNYQAVSPSRHARSRGLSELTLTVSFNDGHPLIVSETSRILRRGASELSALPRDRQDS